MTDEWAEAVQHVARTTRVIAERSSDFVGRVFGPPVEDGVNIVSDRLRFYKLSQWFSLQE